MIRIQRAALPPPVVAYLQQQTRVIKGSPAKSRRSTADTRWKNKSSAQFVVVRQVLHEMCSGHSRCMYCEDSHATDIDHFEPKSTAPERAFDWQNYLAACSHCNSNEKRTAYPIGPDGPLLVDPTSEDPRDHIAFSPTTGEYGIVNGSSKGDPTLTTFGINRGTLPAARKQAWILLECAIEGYARAMVRGEIRRARSIKTAATRHPFAGVLEALIAASSGPLASRVHPGCRAAIVAYPEVSDWFE